NKGIVVNFPKTKKNDEKKKEKNEQTYPFHSFRIVRSASSVRPGSNPKKNNKGMLVMFPKSKKNDDKKKKITSKLTHFIRSEPFNRLRPFVQGPIKKKKKKECSYVP